MHANVIPAKAGTQLQKHLPHELVGRAVRWRPAGPADPAELGQVVAATPRQALVRSGDAFQWLRAIKLEIV